MFVNEITHHSLLSLQIMDIQCSDKELFILKKIAHAAEKADMPSYLIGGFVRDKLLDRPSKDADIVCIGDGIDLAHLAAKEFEPKPHVSFFKNYGTAHIRVYDIDLEFVGARKESYQYHSRNPLVVAGTLEDDLNRRDFTINALAISLNERDFGKLHDLFNGVDDLNNRVIKTPLDPLQTFSDDPLRMMRAIRFASQLSFNIEEKTFQAIKDNAYRINIISQERITEEINKILLSNKPSVGFDLLYQSGLLHIIFPQMVDLAGAEYIDGKGHKDNFYHTLQVIDNVATRSSDLWLRWSAVLHDIAKPVTKKFEEDHGWTFHGHEVIGGRMVPKIFTKFKLPKNEKMRFVRKLVEMHLRPISLTKENITDSAIRRLIFDAGDDIEDLMTLCEADITSKNKYKKTKYLENFQMVRLRCREVEASDRLRNWQPPVSGALIMETFGIKPSRPVGEIKTAIREAILDGKIDNSYEAAFAYMLEKGKIFGLKPVR